MLAVSVAALAAKAVVLVQLHDHPLLQPVGGLDSEVYVALARRVLSGDVLLGPDAYFVSPLYVYVLAALLGATGASLVGVRAAQVLLGAVAVALVGDMAARRFGPRAGVVAAVLAAASGVLSFNEVLILQSALDPFLTALGLWLLARALQGRRAAPFLGTGILLGLHALNRPNVLAWIAALPVLLLLQPWRPRRTAVVAGAAVLAGAALALAPVALRNRAVSGHWLVVSSHGGLNFFIGNRAGADGTYRGVPGITASIQGQAADARRVAETEAGRRLDDAEVSARFYAKAWEWIRSEPGNAWRLFVRKLAYVFNHVDISLNASYGYYAREEGTLLRLLVVGPGVLVPLGLVGLALSARGDAWTRWTWAAFVPVYAVSVAAFFVSGRYRLPLLVPLCVGAGGAVIRLWDHARARRWPPLVAGAAALAVLAMAANADLGLDDGRAQERAQMLLHLADNRRWPELRERLARPEARDLPPEVRLALGQAILDAGRPEDAVEHLRAARGAGLKPEVAGYDLARALLASGREDEARAVLANVPVPPDGDAQSLLALGRLALELGDGPRAEALLGRSAALVPDSADAHEALGAARASLGRRAEAIQALQDALRLDPRRPAAHLNLAVVLAQDGRLAEARTHAQEALRLRPGYPQARGLLEALHAP